MKIMIGYLIVLFLLLPFIDIYLLIEIAGRIGFFETLALIIVTGMVGAVIVRREGRQVFRKLQGSVTAKEVSRNFVEAALLVLGGLMLMSPGLITDFIGLLFVWRPTRERLMLKLVKRMKNKSNFTVQVQSF